MRARGAFMRQQQAASRQPAHAYRCAATCCCCAVTASGAWNVCCAACAAPASTRVFRHDTSLVPRCLVSRLSSSALPTPARCPRRSAVRRWRTYALHAASCCNRSRAAVVCCCWLPCRVLFPAKRALWRRRSVPSWAPYCSARTAVSGCKSTACTRIGDHGVSRASVSHMVVVSAVASGKGERILHHALEQRCGNERPVHQTRLVSLPPAAQKQRENEHCCANVDSKHDPQRLRQRDDVQQCNKQRGICFWAGARRDALSAHLSVLSAHEHAQLRCCVRQAPDSTAASNSKSATLTAKRRTPTLCAL